jgi:hypothetical protein
MTRRPCSSDLTAGSPDTTTRSSTTITCDAPSARQSTLREPSNELVAERGLTAEGSPPNQPLRGGGYPQMRAASQVSNSRAASPIARARTYGVRLQRRV